jgi:hypothetical protein
LAGGGSTSSPTNTTIVQIYLCPSDPNSQTNGIVNSVNSSPNANGWAATNYAANHFMFATASGFIDGNGNPNGVGISYTGAGYSTPPQFKIGNIPDGSSNTIAFVERYAAYVGCDWWQNAWAYVCTSGDCYDSANYPILWNGQAAQNPPILTGITPNQCPSSFQYMITSGHTGVAVTALMDGSIRNLTTSISQATVNLALYPADGAPMPGDWNQ